MANQGIHIGTSGWVYPHWAGVFYPEDVPQEEYLPYYARHFASVEVNNTFYQMPKEEVIERWRSEVPEGFLFSVKASRFITHNKKLKGEGAGEAFRRFHEVVGTLGKQLGPILFQLPPRWRANPERLRDFLEYVPATVKPVFEFRDHSWFDDPVYEVLKAHPAACCWYHLEGFQSPEVNTAPWVYIRLHGSGGKYEGKYSHSQLRRWADKIEACRQEGREVYCYFDNDHEGQAVEDALELQEMMERR